MERYWAKQFDQNYSRSLDHRSFYFKSIDKKALGNRHILSELKDAADAAAARPEAALAVHAGLPAAIKLHPHLLLEMPNKCVLFPVVCHVCDAPAAGKLHPHLLLEIPNKCAFPGVSSRL